VTLTGEEFAAAALAVAIHSATSARSDRVAEPARPDHLAEPARSDHLAEPARSDHLAEPARRDRATGARSTGGWIATGRGRRTQS
jgi:hypothetical protein